MTDTNTTPAPAQQGQGSDPIRPAHYRDPSTGRDRIAVWAGMRHASLCPFAASMATHIDKYYDRRGKKPGATKADDERKAAEFALRACAVDDGALGDVESILQLWFGWDRDMLGSLAVDVERMRRDAPASTPPAAPPAATSDAPQRLYLQWHGDASADEPATATPRDADVTWTRERVHPRDVEYVRADSTPPAAVTPQQAAGARPLPATPRQLVLGNGAVAMHVGTVGDDTHPRMLLLYSVEPGPIGHEDEVGMRPSALPAGASVMPDDPRLDVLIYCGRRESAEMLRDTVQEIIDKWPREEGDDPQAAQDDHAAALHPTRHQVSFALSALSDALGAAEEAGNQYVVDAVNAATEALEDVEAQQDAERERERADRAERALRLERGTPQPGDLPEGWRREPCTPRSYVNGTAKAVCLETGEWRWWCREGWGRSTTAAEAIDAANAAITAQRSDDTARDDSGSAAGEGEVTP